MDRVEVSKVIGRNIREARARVSMTIYTLADATGLAASSISQHETGHRLPQFHTLLVIAKALGVSIQDLLKGCE